MNARRLLLLVSLGLLAVACASAPAASPSPRPSPSPSPSPAPAAGLADAQLKYLLLDAYGPISWCDPDQYPVPVPNEAELAAERFAEIAADPRTLAAILDRLDIVGERALTADEKLAAYREWKLLNAVALTPAGDGFAFELITETDPGLGRGTQTSGTIDRQGRVAVTAQSEVGLASCPICLTRGTMIDTPIGPVAVERLRVGDPIWTVDAAGNRVAGVVRATGSVPVPASHRVVHLVLDDGRELWASPGHPLFDGRLLSELHAGDEVDGALVVSAALVGYRGGRTFDVLADGAFGAYWADGVLLASTLAN